MATTENADDHREPAGAGQAPPVAALRAHGRLRPGRRRPGAGARRGLPRLGRARQSLLRRAQRAVLRQHRPRPRRHRAGRRRPGQGARVLHELVLRAPAGDRACGEDRLARARATSTASSSRAAAREAVESAIKLVRQYHKLTGQSEQDEDHRARDGLPRHDAGRDHRDGHHEPARAVRAVHARRLPRPEHEPRTASPPGYGAENLAEAIADRIEFEGPDTVAAVFLEPVQNAGGCFVPPRGLLPARARDLRRVRRPASSPTRSSARGAASATGSAPSATTTSPTSSRRRRASPAPTRRSAP